MSISYRHVICTSARDRQVKSESKGCARVAHVLMPTEVMQEPITGSWAVSPNRSCGEVGNGRNGCILDLAEATLGEDSLKRSKKPASARAQREGEDQQITLVLMLVIFLIAHPSPVRLCFAATTQPYAPCPSSLTNWYSLSTTNV